MSALGDVGHVILPSVRKAEKQVFQKRLDNNHRGQQMWCSDMEGRINMGRRVRLPRFSYVVENYPLSKKCALGT